MTIDALMRLAPVIPVLVVEDPAQARPIAQAMVAGGLPVLEVTLRTPVALEVIREMSRVDGAIVGGGTVLGDRDLAACLDAGARFIVSPGLLEPLCCAAIKAKVPVLPGVANAGDIMRGLSLGLNRFKFFPAVAGGGLPMLRALSSPFGTVRFCPTGGITGETATDWLGEPAVLCVGGTWLISKGRPDLAAIQAAARLVSSSTS